MPVPPQTHPSAPLPGPWVRLDEAPFEGQWIGLSDDWAEHLPCDPATTSWDRIWIQLELSPRSPLAWAIRACVRSKLYPSDTLLMTAEQPV
jgi:hypothetical protein